MYNDIDSQYGTPIPIYALFYVIMSQYFKNVKIKCGPEKRFLRFHFFWISPSRSGKGQLYKVGAAICKELGISTTVETDISDAGLFGTIDEKAIEFNYKNKLVEGDEKYKNPMVYGDLFNYDIIFFRGVKKLLSPTQHTEMLLSILQEALDEPGYIRKKLRSKYAVEGEVTCSLFATSYFTKDIEETLAKQGFFMRVPLYCREISIAETTLLREGVLDFFKKQEENDFEYYAKKFADTIKLTTSILPRTIVLNDSAINKLKSINSIFNKLMMNTSGVKLQLLKSLSQTMIDVCIKIGAIHACLENKDEIDERYIHIGFDFFKPCIDTILNRVDIIDMKTYEKDKSNEIIIELLKHCEQQLNKKISKDEFAIYIKNKMKIGRNKALIIINNLISENKLRVERGEKNLQYLVPTEV